jgi:hypothetical protein
MTPVAYDVGSDAGRLHRRCRNKGAFSNRAGRVLVQWRWQQNGWHDRLVIVWQEVGGPRFWLQANLAMGQR